MQTRVFLPPSSLFNLPCMRVDLCHRPSATSPMPQSSVSSQRLLRFVQIGTDPGHVSVSTDVCYEHARIALEWRGARSIHWVATLPPRKWALFTYVVHSPNYCAYRYAVCSRGSHRTELALLTFGVCRRTSDVFFFFFIALFFFRRFWKPTSAYRHRMGNVRLRLTVATLVIILAH